MPRRSPPPLILPKTLNPIAYVIGLDRAMALARLAPPCPSRPDKACLYIPRPGRLDDEHLLTRTVGRELALAVCREMGGEAWWPPSGDFLERAIWARLVLDLGDLGYERDEIAERVGLSITSVKGILLAYQTWQDTGDLDAVRAATKMTPTYLSIMLNRGW